MRGLTVSIISLGVFILFSSWSISNAITSSSGNIPQAISVNQNTELSYELVVNDGWLYLYEKRSGDIWKKLDSPEAEWERVKHFSQ